MRNKFSPLSDNNQAPSSCFHKLRPGDILLISVCLFLALFLFLGYLLFFRSPGTKVEISVNGTVTDILPLNKDTIYQIGSGNHKNILKIKDGYASITSADCPDKLCVKQKKINKKGETLVCLPHKVIVTVISSQLKNEFDGISN